MTHKTLATALRPAIEAGTITITESLAIMAALMAVKDQLREDPQFAGHFRTRFGTDAVDTLLAN